MDDGERAYCQEMRMLTTDPQGREVFVGLDRAESEWFHAYLQNTLLEYAVQDPQFWKAGDRYLALHEKHELVRQQILAAEHEAKSVTTMN